MGDYKPNFAEFFREEGTSCNPSLPDFARIGLNFGILELKNPKFDFVESAATTLC